MNSAAHPDLPLTIDLLFLDQPEVIAAFLLRGRDEAALVEVGPASTIGTLLAALSRAEVPRESVRHLLVTHVHLDHAGAAGQLLEYLPNARVYAHEIGVPHLADPARLVASATRIYGAMMDRLWGRIAPVPSERLVALHDGQQLAVAGHLLDVLYTPGHARHHVAFRDVESGVIFTGDAAGVRIEGCSYVRPPTPPPDLDLDVWEETLDRLAALDAPVFYLTHFGRCEGTAEHLAQLRARLRTWEQVVLEGLRAGREQAAIALTLQRLGDEELARIADPATIRRYESASSYVMNAGGYIRYLTRRHPESGTASPR